MSAMAFDTLSTARRLREKGLSQELAEAIAEEFRISTQVDVSHLTTKEELNVFKSELKSDMNALKSELRCKRQGDSEPSADGKLSHLLPIYTVRACGSCCCKLCRKRKLSPSIAKM
jgi:hypothetical protein